MFQDQQSVGQAAGEQINSINHDELKEHLQSAANNILGSL
jgi:hypothetical protein